MTNQITSLLSQVASSLFAFFLLSPHLPLPLCLHQVFYVSDLFKPRVKPATPPPSPIKKELLPSADIIERNNHHNMV